MTTADMKLKLIATLIVTSLGMAAVGTAPAADSRSDSATPAGSAATAAPETTAPSAVRELRASKVIGMRVHNAQGENLGKVDDLIVDVNNERVAYAVLAFGGTLGIGDKLFAYPVSLFQPTADAKALVLNVDKEKLKQAPGFERKNWPDWGKDAYHADIERFFGPTVTPKILPNQRLVRASELIGKKVDDRNGRHAGKIDDLVVNLGNGKAHYAVLDFDKAWSMSDKLLPMSLKSFTYPADIRKDVVVNADRGQLDMSRGFAAKNWPDINDPNYQRDIDNYLARAPAPAGAAGPKREPARE